MYIPSMKITCNLPNLPDKRRAHTQDNSQICGGVDDASSSSCIEWNMGTWNTSVTKLKNDRAYHVSWTPGNESGTYLMGGKGSIGERTELVKNGESVTKFNLHYKTQ